MSIQTSVAIKQGIGLAGQIADTRNRDVVNDLLVEAATLEFGVVVSPGTNDKQVLAGGADPIGMTVRNLSHEGIAATGAVNYVQTEAVDVMIRGPIYCKLDAGSAPVAKRDDVHFDATTGMVRDSGGGNLLPNAKFESAGAAGDLVKVYIR